jgi:hypothetical protein
MKATYALRFVSLLSALAWCACSPGRVNLQQGELARLRQEGKIEVVTHSPEPFAFITAEENSKDAAAAVVAGALTGGIGGFFVGRNAENRARENGRAFAAANGVDDPASRVRDAFTAALVNQFALRNLATIGDAPASDDAERMRQVFGAATVLDFKTYRWRLVPIAMRDRYRLYYALRARLLRLNSGATVWQGYCRYDSGDSDLVLEELTADSGRMLRAKINEAADSCAANLLVQFLGQD